ncbi:MAG: hypothetical protein HMLKMBBP_03412 [Planctomycetes bacterium]|nr:hypothetical protein [Planctomycetota bacterium]
MTDFDWFWGYPGGGLARIIHEGSRLAEPAGALLRRSP